MRERERFWNTHHQQTWTYLNVNFSMHQREIFQMICSYHHVYQSCRISPFSVKFHYEIKKKYKMQYRISLQ